MLKTLFRSAFLIGGVCLVLGGIIYLGQIALENLRAQDRFKVSFADILCEPPPGLSRVDFLDEVQYLSNFSPEINLLEEGLPDQLTQAFAQHPWVEKVEGVQLLPANTVRIQLKYRTPVLAVPWDGLLRAVDANGILLPTDANITGLPVFPGRPRPPQGPAGAPWGDPVVLSAAKKAAKGE